MRVKFIVSLLAVITLLSGQTTFAYYTQDNFWTVKHEPPAWFETDALGGFFGETVDGQRFTQRPIILQSEIRLHRFEIGLAFFYISDRGVIIAGSDLAALSIYHTLT